MKLPFTLRFEQRTDDIPKWLHVTKFEGACIAVTDDRGRKVIPNLIPKVKIEIAVNDEFVDVTVDTIIKSAKSSNEGKEDGMVGDGKIFITPLEECIRIRTKERGGSAI